MSRSTRNIGDIILWSGVSNLVLAGVFFLGWNFDTIRKTLLEHAAAVAPASVSQKVADPLALSRLQRQDNELLTKGPQRQLKGPLQMSVVPSSSQAPAIAVEEPGAPGVAADGGLVVEAASYEYGPEADGPQAMSPVLSKNPRTGQLEIGNFQTVSLDGDSDQCLALAETMLGDVGAPSDSLQVLSDSKLITMARICTANGAVLLTCRGGQITISPRKLKPNESCTS
ncbi:hypothetical protein [Aestuariivirga sp.]|uniref:hypothetical protein n=1 Tax=Aestuariivirga sp. TaxID=2650926 RepID=UPI003919B5A4